MGAEAPKRDAAAAAWHAAAAVMAGAHSGAAGMADEGEALSALVLDALPVGVALLDAQLRWRYANDAFLRLTGLPPEATSGRPLSATPLRPASTPASAWGPGGGTGIGTGMGLGTVDVAAAAALVLADGATRELVTGPADEPIRMRLQRIAPEAATPAPPPTAVPAPPAPARGDVPATEPTPEAVDAPGAETTVESGTVAEAERQAEASTTPATAPGAQTGAETGRAPRAGRRAGRPPETTAGSAPLRPVPPAEAESGAMVLVVALLEAAPPPPPPPPPLAQSEAGARAEADATPDADARAGTAGAVPPGAEGAAATAAAASQAQPGGPSGAAPSEPPDGEERARRRLATLTAAAERIGTTLDTDTTCAELARFTVPGLADLATVDILPPGVPEHRLGMPLGTLRLLRAAVAARPELHPHLATLAHPGESVRHREGSLVARSLVAAKPVLLDLAAIDEGAEGAAAISDPATLEVYRAAGIASVLAVPLAARGHLVGALTLARAPHGSGEGFSDEDVALIEDLGGRAALSIDNARRFMRSQGIALELQRALLAEPANPHPNMEIACRYLPSGSSSVVGGDWYESVRLPFGRTLLVIGDVMGHGVEAAVDMSTYRSMLRYVAVMDLPPHRILRQLDAMISENDAARPATCLLALVDPPRNRVTFASAGHLPPALVDPNGVTELVPVPSAPPLGTGIGGYQQLVRELKPGAVLLLYTDGLVERRHEDIDVSLERLAALPLPVAGDLDDLLDAALHSSTPSEAEDDIAVLAARVRPRPS